jgi:hypothetical protein
MGPQLPAGGRDGSGGRGEPQLEALISAGLAGEVGGPVDVSGLLDGARTGARRIRRRRRVATATALAVVVIAVPVSLTWTGQLGGRLSGTEAATAAGTAMSTASSPAFAAAGPGGSTSADSQVLGGTELSQPGQDVVPSAIRMSSTAAAVLSRDASGRYVVGEQALLPAADLASVASLTLTQEGPTVDRAGPTATPVCRTLPAASAHVAAGRSAVYAGAGAGAGAGDAGAGAGADGWVVRLVVRVLPQTAASDEMDWLRRSMGYCPSDLHLRRATVTDLPGNAAVLGYQVGADPQHPESVLVIGAVRQGRATAAVEMVVPTGTAADVPARVQVGLDRTRRLLTLADQRLKSSRLVELAQGDPALAS